MGFALASTFAVSVTKPSDLAVGSFGSRGVLRIVALTNRDDASFDLFIAQYRLLRAIGDL